MKERQSNIELLRILSTIGVIILHYNNREIGGAFLYTQGLSLNHAILVVFESVAVCAVDLFIMISGYFLAKKNERDLLKVIQLIFQVMVFSELIYLVRGILGRGELSIRGILMAAIPNNYFVTLYCVLYVLSPLINFSINRISKKYLFRTLIMVFLIFSIFPSIVDFMNTVSNRSWNGLSTIGMFGSQWGYTIVNFSLMYCMGAFLREVELERIKLHVLTVSQILFISVISLLAWFNEDVSWSYCSPLVILEAIGFMLIFLKTNIGSIRIINNLSKACFTCFLTHTLFLKFVGIKQFSTGNPIVLIIHVLLSALAIFLACFIVNLAYSFGTSFIWNKMGKNRFSIQYEDLK